MEFQNAIQEIKTAISEKRVNFLVGSGASSPYFPTLNNIEEILTGHTLTSQNKELIYLIYFLEVVEKNLYINDLYIKKNYDVPHKDIFSVYHNYVNFINSIIKKMGDRNSRISPTRVNIFTTNYDLFLEVAIDKEISQNPSAIFNDGASGVFKRYLSSDNYHKTVSRNGAFDNYHIELPTINLVKCHGSVSWEASEVSGNKKIKIDNNLDLLNKVKEDAEKVGLDSTEFKEVKEFLENFSGEEKFHEITHKYSTELKEFFSSYSQLMIINPEKTKFKNTLMEEHYYSMLRLLSYELEREQSILIVFGFSFADEHIRNLIKRSIFNPALKIYIFAFKNGQKESLQNLLECRRVNNIEIIEPEDEERNIDFTYFNELLFGGINI
ncbi:SIR2 family protein [Metaplanococcus flavidus]|uniref:SIR2 family protein n=1 Tax=Metaplanococcus flavidus TaxID=569883 RepID=A0ABW3LF01_9BACL